MKKLKLEIETLAVSTFATDAAGAEGRGTVPANDMLAPTQAMTCVTCTRHTDPCLCTPTPLH
jgi:hypothetical protein